MKPLFLIFSACSIVWQLHAQNLVPDGGFERYKYCPVTFNQGGESHFKVWTQPTLGTSDYFNACSRIVGTPKNAFGYQMPHNGAGYAGLVLFSPSQRNYREYLQVRLQHPLEQGRQYCVRAYFSLADKSTFMIDGMGITLAFDEVKQADDKVLVLAPQVTNPSGHVVREDINWWELSGMVTAKGGEQFLVLGNFSADAQLNINRRKIALDDPWELAYYYVDDVEVVPVRSRSECSCTADRIAEIMVYPGLKDAQYSQVQAESVLFPFDGYGLDVRARKQLIEIAGILAANSEYYLQIMGHTDVIGSAVYNDTLSLKRAESVLDFLRRKGIDNQRLSVNYFGSRKPVASNSAEAGRSRNRRVEFVILRRNYEDYRLY